MDKRNRVQRGKDAERAALDPVLLEAFAALEQQYTDEWKSSKVDDMVNREQAYARVTALTDLMRQLQSYVDDAKIANKQLERDQKL
jgi:hypothetical protein|tara:strand:+ start:320 stop:577 length:258 start_codon:yes stop_codon:yes gene_type:complete